MISYICDVIPHLHEHQNHFLLKTLELCKTSVTFCCNLFKGFFFSISAQNQRYFACLKKIRHTLEISVTNPYYVVVNISGRFVQMKGYFGCIS